MLRTLISPVRGFPPIRSAIVLRRDLVRLPKYIPQARTVATTSPKAAPKKPKYPERLLIYHAGTGRTAFIGCMKVTTIMIFGFFSLLIAPSHLLHSIEGSPIWFAPTAVFFGVAPMVFFTALSKPYVTYIHLRVPPFARNSSELLSRFSKNPPKDTKIELTTLNLIGMQQVTRVLVSDLVPFKRRFSLANYALLAEKIERTKKLPWWKGMPLTKYAVLGGAGKVREAGLWENISKVIQRRAN